jgi:hypothetical protein
MRTITIIKCDICKKEIEIDKIFMSYIDEQYYEGGISESEGDVCIVCAENIARIYMTKNI